MGLFRNVINDVEVHKGHLREYQREKQALAFSNSTPSLTTSVPSVLWSVRTGFGCGVIGHLYLIRLKAALPGATDHTPAYRDCIIPTIQIRVFS